MYLNLSCTCPFFFVCPTPPSSTHFLPPPLITILVLLRVSSCYKTLFLVQESNSRFLDLGCSRINTNS